MKTLRSILAFIVFLFISILTNDVIGDSGKSKSPQFQYRCCIYLSQSTFFGGMRFLSTLQESYNFYRHNELNKASLLNNEKTVVSSSISSDHFGSEQIEHQSDSEDNQNELARLETEELAPDGSGTIANEDRPATPRLIAMMDNANQDRMQEKDHPQPPPALVESAVESDVDRRPAPADKEVNPGTEESSLPPDPIPPETDHAVVRAWIPENSGNDMQIAKTNSSDQTNPFANVDMVAAGFYKDPNRRAHRDHEENSKDRRIRERREAALLAALFANAGLFNPTEYQNFSPKLMDRSGFKGLSFDAKNFDSSSNLSFSTALHNTLDTSQFRLEKPQLTLESRPRIKPSMEISPISTSLLPQNQNLRALHKDSAPMKTVEIETNNTSTNTPLNSVKINSLPKQNFNVLPLKTPTPFKTSTSPLFIKNPDKKPTLKLK